MKIIADSHIPFIKEYFGVYDELVLKAGRTISPADVKEADILIVRSVTHVDKRLLENTQVKFVGSVTAGADHLDTKWLDETGIEWSVAVGFNAPPVADYVMSVIAALQQKQGLAKKKLKAAVIGVGNVGRLVVERLRLLNVDVTLCDPLRAEKEKDFESTPIEALSDLDFISLHVPLTMTGKHATYHFINKAFLQRQNKGCILLNASRGSVIHSQDLIQYGRHLHWCLDVWEHEPRIDKKILEQAIVATPHIAGYSLQSKIRGIDMIYRVACEKKIIEWQPLAPIIMPHQQLSFSGRECHWQEIVLGAFNPLVITHMMKTMLMPVEDSGHSFDEMRHQFNYRHEFQYTRIVDAKLSHEDIVILQQLGFK